MAHFKRDNKSSGGKKFGGDRDFNDRDDRRPQMHTAVCGDCGQSCEVPFRPSGDRPVYCQNCFAKHRPTDSGRSNDRGNRDNRDNRRPSFGEKQMFSATCAKCGNRCEVPFRPNGEKPVYCSQCFTKDGGSKGSAVSGDQFAALNAKLDKILKLLNPNAAVETIKPVKAEKSAPIVVEKKEPVKAKVVVKKVAKKKKK